MEPPFGYRTMLRIDPINLIIDKNYFSVHWDVEAMVQTPEEGNISTTLTPVSPLGITSAVSRKKRVVMDQMQDNLIIFLVM